MADCIKNDSRLLLEQFNKREPVAFSEIYKLLHQELHYFASQLYRDNASFAANDILHDIFVELWQKKHQKFETIGNIKAFMYVSIKNKFKSDVRHKRYIDKYNCELKLNKNSFISNIIETETLSILSQAIDLLPSECAKVFKMHIDGWDVKEIAQHLGKSQSTIYNQRHEAISILKKKLSNRSLTLLFNFFLS